MTRKQPRRTSAALQKIIVSYLNVNSPMRFNCTVAQIKSAAKKIQRSGYLPRPVADALKVMA